METRLYIGNMSKELTEQDLRAMFTEAGAVKTVDIVMDSKSGRPRGFAFVTMNSQEEAEKAIALIHGKEINGQAMKVNITLPREERPDQKGN
jgi:cold-inducible RNA-binding protein